MPLLLILGVVAVLSPQLIDKVGDLFGSSDPVIISSGEATFLVGSDGESETKRCDAANTAKYQSGSCDEYAFATTEQGGAGARVEEVPLREQRCQGGAVNAGYVKANIQQGDDFLVVIDSPSEIASGTFTGRDTAQDQSCDR